MNLQGYLDVVRTRKWVIFLAVFLAVASAVGLSLLQTPVYEGHTRVLLQPSKTVFEVGSGQATISGVRVATEIQIFESAQVQALVRKNLGVAPKATVVQIGETDVVDVSAESTVPLEAASIANAYAEAYIDFRRQQAVDGLLAAAEQIQRKINDLQKPIDDLTAAAAAANAANQRPGSPAQPFVNSPDREALVSQQALFKQRLDQLQVDTALKDGGAQLVGPATPPTSPIRPRPVHDALLALAAGIIVGLGAAFLIDHLDDSIKTAEDLEHVGDGLSVLGVIPYDGGRNSKGRTTGSLNEPSPAAAEAYRALRTTINFLALDRSIGAIQIASPSSGDGKTITLANLAIAMSKAGQTVILFDCDLRRPRLHEFFGLSNEVGFTNVLLGQASLSTAIQEVNPRLRILTSGPLPTNPSELLSSNRAAELLAAGRSNCDMLLIDCPPVLPVTDAVALSSKVDGILMVVKAGTTSIREASQTLDLLRRVQAPVMGAVLNGAVFDRTSRYQYGQSYGPVPRKDDKRDRFSQAGPRRTKKVSARQGQ